MVVNMRYAILLCLAAPCHGYSYPCLSNKCNCDTDTRVSAYFRFRLDHQDAQVIDCQSKDLFTMPTFPPRPLYGFTILSLRGNCLTEVPFREIDLLRAFPDLMVGALTIPM